jgi:hypothetical protein
MKIIDKYFRLPELENRTSDIIISSEKKLLVVTPNMSEDQESRKTLIAIINAMKLDAKSDVNYAFVNDDNNIYCEDLLDGVKLVILFGIPPEQLNININEIKYHLLKLEKYNLIYCDDMAMLNNNKALKMKLWNIIKDITL